MKFAVALLALLPMTAAAEPLQLSYNASVGVAPAGVIDVELERDEHSYRVSGQAKARGLLELIKATRGWFEARGSLDDDRPLGELYEYFQKDKDRERFISVSQGQLTYVKDGQARPLSPAKAGIDLVTALWIEPECADVEQVHTGRSAYRFDLLSDAEGLCRYRVKELEEDEPPFDLDVRYDERQGVRVPVSIRSTGGWAGRLTLAE